MAGGRYADTWARWWWLCGGCGAWVWSVCVASGGVLIQDAKLPAGRVATDLFRRECKMAASQVARAPFQVAATTRTPRACTWRVRAVIGCRTPSHTATARGSRARGAGRRRLAEPMSSRRRRTAAAERAEVPAGRFATDLSTGSSKMAAKAQRRRRAGARCGGAAHKPSWVGNGSTGDPLARRSVGSVCSSINVDIRQMLYEFVTVLTKARELPG
jgi:hypothetical protein